MVYLSFPVSKSVDPSSDDRGVECLHSMRQTTAAYGKTFLSEVKFTILNEAATVSPGPPTSRSPVSTTVNFGASSPLATGYDQMLGASATSVCQTERPGESASCQHSVHSSLPSIGTTLYPRNDSSALSKGCLTGVVVASVVGGVIIIAIVIVLYSRRYRQKPEPRDKEIRPFSLQKSRLNQERLIKGGKGWSSFQALTLGDQCNRIGVNLQCSSSHTESSPDSSILTSHEPSDVELHQNPTSGSLPQELFHPQFVAWLKTRLGRELRRNADLVLGCSHQEHPPCYSPV